MVTGNYFNDMEKGEVILNLCLIYCCCFVLLIYRCRCHPLEVLNFNVTLLLESTLQKISLKLFYMEVKVPNITIRQAQQYTDLVNNFNV